MSTSSLKHVPLRSTSLKHGLLDALHVEWAFTHEHTSRESARLRRIALSQPTVRLALHVSAPLRCIVLSRVARRYGNTAKGVADSSTITWRRNEATVWCSRWIGPWWEELSVKLKCYDCKWNNRWRGDRKVKKKRVKKNRMRTRFFFFLHPLLPFQPHLL